MGPNNPNTTNSNTPSTIASQSQVGKKTPVLATSETSLPPIEEERDNPTLDRGVDLLAVAAPHAISIDQTEVFEQLVNAYQKKNGEHLLSLLPASVRYKIYGFCFNDHDGRKINLSPKFAVRAVFPDDYFISPWTVLDPVLGSIHAFRALRHDLMNYFWTSYHFHVTINVFSGPIFSPLSHVWLLNFLDRIQRLTIEVDLTRLGGSALRLAATFGHNNDKVEKLVQGLFQKLLERPDRLTMAELNLMCRRYGGFRPRDEPDSAAGLPYLPDDEIYVIEMMPELRGILQRCRISGFTFEYTKHMLSAVFGDEVQGPELIIPSDPPWPPATIPVVEKSVVTSYLPAISAPAAPSGLGLTLHHRRSLSDDIAAPSAFPSFGLTLHHSRSFSDEMDDEMSRFSSIFDFTAPFTGVLLEEHRHSAEDPNTEDLKGSTVRASIISDGSTSLGSPTGASTPHFEHLGQGEILCTRTFGFSESHRSPSPPKSPETLNKMNERDPAFIRAVSALKTQSQLEANDQDPAFIRAVQAMRSNSQTDAPPVANENTPIASITTVTMIVGPAQRSVSSMSSRPNDTKGSIKRRYTSIMDRLRGRANT
ncbi:hypothetical protein N431DRAFT_495309 [Stipitochalara longipes BDJ]|nr:hypothetical protein N431DRAFT_495309 [Stipitochalara longipes BDJ]